MQPLGVMALLSMAWLGVNGMCDALLPEAALVQTDAPPIQTDVMESWASSVLNGFKPMYPPTPFIIVSCFVFLVVSLFLAPGEF